MAKKQVKAAGETTIYIGRSLPGLPQYTVFQSGHLPAHIALMVESNHNLAGLIVPVRNLQEARKNIRIKGHILNMYANQLLTKE